MSKRIVLLQALAATLGDLARMVGPVKTTCHLRPAPEAWSVLDVVEHLVDVERRYRVRLQRVVEEDHPTLPFILPGPLRPMPQTSPTQAARALETQLAAFEVARGQTIDYLTALPPGDWQRKAILEDGTPTTFRTLLQHLSAHDTQHLGQILDLRKKALEIAD